MKSSYERCICLADLAEVLLDELGTEAVVAGGDRGMGREAGHGGHVAHGLAEGDLLGLHLGADHLQAGEGAVPLIQMDHGRGNPHRVQGSDAADAQQQLLPDAHAGVAPVEARGQGAVRLVVLRDVGVHQQEGRAADLDPPDLGVQGADVALDGDRHRLARRVDRFLDGQEVAIRLEVSLLLPPIRVQGLPEIPLVVQQADAHQGDAQVARTLEVVARQDAQPAGIDGQALVEPELGGEVGDGAGSQAGGVRGAPTVGVLEVVVQAAEGVVDPRVEGHLGGAALELLGGDLLEELDRVVVGRPPEDRVEFPEEVDDVGLPGPPEVPRQLPELLDQDRLSRHVATPKVVDPQATAPIAGRVRVAPDGRQYGRSPAGIQPPRPRDAVEGPPAGWPKCGGRAEKNAQESRPVTMSLRGLSQSSARDPRKVRNPKPLRQTSCETNPISR